MILSIQCIESLRKSYPDSIISFLMHSSMSEYFKNNPYLNNVFFINNKNILKQLKEVKIDVSISIPATISSIKNGGKVAEKKSTILLFRAGIRMRIGVFSGLHSLLFNYKIKQRRTDSNKHEILHNLALLKPLGCKNSQSESSKNQNGKSKNREIFSPKIYLNINEKSKSHLYLESKFNKSTFENLIIIAPNAPNNTNTWSIKNFLSLANELSKTHLVLIIYNKNELEYYKNIIKYYDNLSENNLFILDSNSNESNRTNFSNESYTRLLLATISYANLFISNHNTFLYVAYALGIRTLNIMPNITNHFISRFSPINPKDFVITQFGLFGMFDLSNNSFSKKNMILKTEKDTSNKGLSKEIVLDMLQNKILQNL